jgi:UDP-N-acetylglucosamine 2-epimerase
VQKEAYIHEKPCITLRSETEWVETIQAGWNLLLTPESGILTPQIEQFSPPASHPDLYGSMVAEKMVEILRDRL